jgi:hypothetical protein
MVRYSTKELLTVTILIMILMGDLACQDNDMQRFYFMYDLINRLIMNIAGL